MNARRMLWWGVFLAVIATAFVVKGVFVAVQPGQLTGEQAQARRTQVATADQRRLTRVAKREAELQECRAKADQLAAEMRSTAANGRSARQEGHAVQLDALRKRIQIIETELQSAYYVTPTPSNSADRTAAENAALTYMDEELVELEGELVNVRNRLSDKTDPLLAARNFSELDRIASELRTSKAECASGAWHLRAFYDGFAMLPDHLPESAWTDQIATFQAWISERPDSITPRVALANLWCEWAWRARGGSYAPGVPARGRQLFGERLGDAAKVLEEARGLSEKCPGWWDIAQRAALGQAWPRAAYDQLFEEAIQFEPRYAGYYTNKNNYLLPRWFGNPGDCAAFAAEAADRIGGEDGDMLYARLFWRQHALGIYAHGPVVAQAGASWPRVRAGLEAILQRHPGSISAASELCYLSGEQKEHKRMQQLFAQIGPFIDTTVYADNKQFLRDRRAAFQE